MRPGSSSLGNRVLRAEALRPGGSRKGIQKCAQALRIQEQNPSTRKGGPGSPAFGIWGRNQGISLLWAPTERLLQKNALELHHLI